MVQLNGYKVNKMSVENTAKPGTQLKLQNKIKYNVNYMDNDNKCVGILEFRIIDSDLNPFEVRIELLAEFSYDDTDEKADIHTNSFDQIFPFVRQLVNQLTAQTGMAGLMIPIMKLDKGTVSVGKNTPNTPNTPSTPNDDENSSPLN